MNDMVMKFEIDLLEEEVYVSPRQAHSDLLPLSDDERGELADLEQIFSNLTFTEIITPFHTAVRLDPIVNSMLPRYQELFKRRYITDNTKRFIGNVEFKTIVGII